MDSPDRNGDAHIPSLIVIAYEDVYGAISFVSPDWRVGAGADLERAPLVPVRLLDACELHSSLVVAEMFSSHVSPWSLTTPGYRHHCGLDGHVHHGLIVAAAMTRDKPGLPAGCPRPGVA